MKCITRWRGYPLAALGMTLCFATLAPAQTLRGVVSDSARGIPLPGAVVAALDAAGATLARTISNASGEYRLPELPAMRRLRVTRLGFRPRVIDLASPRTASMDILLAALPTMLEQVRVVANASCPRRSDRAAALGLLEQARAGLLNAVTARQTNPAAMTVLSFDRTMEGASDSIVEQQVRITSGDRVATPFYAVRSAADFVRHGFSEDSGNTRAYYGPDIDVLLDENFSAGYCFHLRPPHRNRPNEVGLGFVAANRRQGRLDVDGTLWIDTAGRKLRELEFRYVGMPRLTESVRPGGRMTFWELANGIVFIDKWNFRLPIAQGDTTYDLKNDRRVRTWYAAREPGGELASAQWPDGHAYNGPLGTLAGRAMDRFGKPVTGFTVRLAGTDYIASPDSLGLFGISELLPGPYTAVIIHPDLIDLGITLPSALRFVAVRDSVISKHLVLPDISQLVRKPCSVNPAAYQADAMLTLRIEGPDGRALKGARWQISKETLDPWDRVTESRLTDADGVARHCMVLQRDDIIEVRAWWGDQPSKVVRRVVGKRDATLTIKFEKPPTLP